MQSLEKLLTNNREYVIFTPRIHLNWVEVVWWKISVAEMENWLYLNQGYDSSIHLNADFHVPD